MPEKFFATEHVPSLANEVFFFIYIYNMHILYSTRLSIVFARMRLEKQKHIFLYLCLCLRQLAVFSSWKTCGENSHMCHQPRELAS